MQNAVSIVRQPILIGLLLSVAVHAAMLHGHSIYTPPVPHMETGRTTLQLTLLPSPSSASEDSPATAPVPALTELQMQQPHHNVAPVESAEQPSPAPPTQTEELKGITASAVARSPFHPTYPRISRQRGEEGTVTLLVQVLPDGSAGTIDIIRSSGYRRLDRAAVDAAGLTAYDPAMVLGHAVESVIELSYTYRLTDD